MLENVTSLIGLPGAVLAVWVVLIGALFLVTRGLSRSLAWAFVVAGVAVPALVLQVWPLTSVAACEETVLDDGDSRDGRYAYRILKSQCHASSETAYRVDLGRKDAESGEADLRPVVRSYGFPRPVAVRQVIDNHFLIYLTSNGRDQVPLRISLDPVTGEPSYVHRFFQGHSDRSFTVSKLPEPAEMSGRANADKSSAEDKAKKCEERKNTAHRNMNSRVLSNPSVTPGSQDPGETRTLRFRLTLRGIFSGS